MAIVFFALWLFNCNTIYIILTCVFGFIALLEFVAYGQTTLELTDDYLKVQRKALLSSINEKYTIELRSIQSSFYENKKYDSWELYQRVLWELFFPSGQSYLVILELNGKMKEIPFNGNENELLELMQQLPDRIPN
jgi:hypothetical protein